VQKEKYILWGEGYKFRILIVGEGGGKINILWGRVTGKFKVEVKIYF